SLRYFDVAVPYPSPEVPQYTSVGYVDGIPFSYYDSESRRAVPKAEWILGAMDPQFWKRETRISQRNQKIDRGNLEKV
ncbi:HA1F protein, partial [Bucco capensis]|nr:HA1F protein [Bucco capensis]